MGRGSYYGGSTIIGPGTNWSDDQLTPPKSKKKTKRSFKKIKIDFLNLVVDSEINGNILTSIPKKSKEALSKLVRDKGGIKKWAESQPQYKEVKTKKLKN